MMPMTVRNVLKTNEWAGGGPDSSVRRTREQECCWIDMKVAEVVYNEWWRYWWVAGVGIQHAQGPGDEDHDKLGNAKGAVASAVAH